jgi:N-acetylmuramic acid 6-phosphate etherase
MDLLRKADGHVKLAVVMHKRGVDASTARGMLEKADGKLRQALEAAAR